MIIFVVIIAVIFIVGGGMFFFSNSSSETSGEQTPYTLPKREPTIMVSNDPNKQTEQRNLEQKGLVNQKENPDENLDIKTNVNKNENLESNQSRGLIPFFRNNTKPIFQNYKSIFEDENTVLKSAFKITVNPTKEYDLVQRMNNEGLYFEIVNNKEDENRIGTITPKDRSEDNVYIFSVKINDGEEFTIYYKENEGTNFIYTQVKEA